MMSYEQNPRQSNPERAGPHVQQVVQAARQELRALVQQRAEIMKRIGSVRQTILGLANLFGNEVLDQELLSMLDRKTNSRQSGFTKACRSVLIEAGRPLTARDLCAQLQAKAASVLVNHKDPRASVTTVMNRLVDYGEVRTWVDRNGKRVWEWLDSSAQNQAEGAGHKLETLHS